MTGSSEQNNELPVIAIVGRPNVGKSALFNRIIGRRLSIVHEESGVTRDRIISPAEWCGKPFTLIDTGGLGIFHKERGRRPFDEMIRDQLDAALETADHVILVVDVIEGIAPMDHEVAQLLRRSGRPVTIAANKADNAALADRAAEAAELGLTQIFAVSCVHGLNIGELLDHATTAFPVAPTDRDRTATNIAVVGRPNAGKSSIVNRLLNVERVMVSDIAGTTRDAVDIPLTAEIDDRSISLNLIDTAGIQRKRNIKSALEYFSMNRTIKAIQRADIVCMVLDAAADFTVLDKQICKTVADEYKPCILLANKWDVACKRTKQRELLDLISHTFPFVNYAPMVTCCALSGYNFKDIVRSILDLSDRVSRTIPTSIVNRIIQDITARHPPPMTGDKMLKIYYAVFKAGNPPTFILFINKKSYLRDNYLAFITKQFRRAFDLDGLPIKIKLSEKPVRGRR